MTMRWYETSSKLFAHGAVKHSVWGAFASSGFYAKSGMDVHGPYETASRARKACEDIEGNEAEAADRIDAQATTIKVLVEALEFYGSHGNYEITDQGFDAVYKDGGDIARSALSAAKETDND